jgi:hypothetical protein
MNEFMRDVGIAGQLPLTRTAATCTCPANEPERAIVDQFRGLTNAIGLCGCIPLASAVVFHVFVLNCRDGASPEDLFRTQAERIREEGTITRCLEECEGRYMAMPLGWQWWGVGVETARGGHLTVLIYDKEQRVQWFFNPEGEDLALSFSDWMGHVQGTSNTAVPWL